MICASCMGDIGDGVVGAGETRVGCDMRSRSSDRDAKGSDGSGQGYLRWRDNEGEESLKPGGREPVIGRSVGLNQGGWTPLRDRILCSI